MTTDPRTVTVDVIVHKPLNIDEPDWCTGHPDARGGYKVDIAHNGPEHVIAPAGRELFRAYLTQAPYSSVDRTVGLYVEAAEITLTDTPEGVARFADELTAAAEELRLLARELARIHAGGAQ